MQAQVIDADQTDVVRFFVLFAQSRDGEIAALDGGGEIITKQYLI